MSGTNPDLGSAENPTLAPHVPAIARFKTELASSTPTPPIVVENEEKCYVSQMPNASLHTPDGTRITFVGGFFRTSLKHIKEYFTKELELGFINSYVREATPEEIHSANMRRDPKGTVEKQVREELEPAMRKELETQILAQVLGVSVEDVAGNENVILAGNIDALKIAGVDVKGKLAALKAAATANFTPVIQPVHPMQASMTGTDKVSAGAADGPQVISPSSPSPKV